MNLNLLKAEGLSNCIPKLTDQPIFAFRLNCLCKDASCLVGDVITNVVIQQKVVVSVCNVFIHAFLIDSCVFSAGIYNNQQEDQLPSGMGIGSAVNSRTQPGEPAVCILVVMETVLQLLARTRSLFRYMCLVKNPNSMYDVTRSSCWNSFVYFVNIMNF